MPVAALLMEKPKVIVDTNILVSILKGSVNLAPIYAAFRNDKFILVVNQPLLKELAFVLSRPRLKINSADVRELFRVIKLKAFYVKNSSELRVTACRDPKDNFILELAAHANADFIVTGDKDLLELLKYQSCAIITPRKFIETFSALGG
jgi:uncharacterized protein